MSLITEYNKQLRLIFAKNDYYITYLKSYFIIGPDCFDGQKYNFDFVINSSKSLLRNILLVVVLSTNFIIHISLYESTLIMFSMFRDTEP